MGYETQHLADLAKLVKEVPREPGVYLWKDASGAVLYVGKAKSLRDRMKQYLTGQDERAKIPLMMQNVASFDYVVTTSEVESLILEVNLIGQFSPPYNVDYRDDKSFPFIAVTTGDRYPAIKYTREKRRPDTRYFGPYTDARAARETVDAVRRVIPLCRCSCAEWRRLKAHDWEPLDRPCFDSHIGLGPGACAGTITPQEYAVNVEKVLSFLAGNHSTLERELKERMDEASAELDFEGAARYRNRLQAVQAIRGKQAMVADASLNLDVVGFYREETVAGAYVLIVREGRVLYGNEFTLDKGLDIPESELISGFLTRYYSEATHIPHEIALATLPDDAEALSEWLGARRALEDKRTKTVKLVVPVRGVRRELIEMTERNARHHLLRFMVRTHYNDKRINAALVQLESALALPAPPLRIECYDISTLHGSFSVGSMIVFERGLKNTAQYRRFKIRTQTDEANDVAMMREVFARRFSSARREDKRFGSLPQLVVIDGGKPQLNAARAVLAELDIDVPLVGLAKRDEEIWVTWSDAPVILPDGSESLYLIKQVRDEAHRFAITYHRELRGKAMTVSVLDEVVGLGPKRRKALRKVFPSFKALSAASVQELADAGLPLAVANDVYRILHLNSPKTEEQQ